MNWDIWGHQWAVDLLRENIQRNSLRHAYLLTGSPGVGRRTLALRLAQAINCPHPSQPGDPCRQCSACKKILDMTHPDLNIIQAEEIGGTLKVDQVRALQHSLALTPYESKYRVALLLRFEEAHISASNALLKTLEEPNPQVVILLTASSPEALLPTIVSRCELVRLRPMPVSELALKLQDQLSLSAEQANFLAHISAGRPGHAINLHNQPDLLDLRSESLDDMFSLLSATRQERFAYAESLANDKDTARSRLIAWITIWRDVLLMATKPDTAITNIDYYPHIQKLNQILDLPTAYQYVAQIERTLDQIGKNVNVRLAVEVLLLDLPLVAEGFLTSIT